MALNLNPKGPLFLGGLALAGFWLVSRAAAKKPTTTHRAVQAGSQTYSTPTSVAAAFAAFVVASTRTGAQPTVRQDNVDNTNWKPWGEQATEAGKKYIEANPQLGVFTFGAGVGQNIDGAWKPNYSFVKGAGNGGAGMDDFGVVPVYDIGTDFINNPANMWGSA